MKKEVYKDAILLNQLHTYVEQHWQGDIRQLAFKKELVAGWDKATVLNQLHGKQKAKDKLPFLFKQKTILYPLKVSVEQSTSQRVAEWKAVLVGGASMLDMTGGFGIDSFFFSQQVDRLTYIEQQQPLFDIVVHNFKQLAATNITCHPTNAVDFLQKTTQQFDWIYLDPARRDEVGNRKVGLTGYIPNVLEIKDLLLEKGQQVLIKTSPMLDIYQAIQQLGAVAKIWVVALQNEVKELLFLLSKNSTKPPEFQCVNLMKDGTSSMYTPSSSSNEVSYAIPKTYLYEPNATILKAGLFQEIAIDFNLAKLHPNTHLYTSDAFVPNFPGRVFNCEAVVPYQRKQILPFMNSAKANITTRNFPDSVAQIKKKLKVKDGGAQYLFGTTLMDGSLKILVCRKARNTKFIP